jgi:PTS system nitrogen regulatory IIA component
MGRAHLVMKIAEFLSPNAVVSDLSATSKPDALRELCTALSRSLPAVKPERLLEVLQEREKLGSTGIGEGVAIPHGKLAGIPQLVAAFGINRAGVNFDAIDGKPTQLFFALVAPENSAGIHLKALARISRLFKNPGFRASILAAKSNAEIYNLISQEDSKV